MNSVKSTTIEYIPDLFLSISRDEILAANILPMDIFLKISENRLVLIGRQGSQFSENLHVLEKDKTSFYIRKEDFKLCVGQNLIVAGIALEKSNLTDQTKMLLISKTTGSVFKEIESIGFSHESLEHAKIISQSIQSLVAAKSDIHGVLTIMADVSDHLLRHSMAVGAISVMIARSMGWSMAATLEKVALGGLLHDIGMKELPKEILEKPRHQLSLEERQVFETHVYRGVEILSTMPSVPADIVAIALEHHENAIGQGYPRRLRDIKMNPLARVVALADCFCELTLKSVDHPKPKIAAEAISFIETTLGQPFSKPAFQGLRTALIKVENSGKVKIVG